MQIKNSPISLSTECLLAAKSAVNRVLELPSRPAFAELPLDDELWSSVSRIAKNLRQDFDKMIVVGTGGSSLGGRALVECFSDSNWLVEFWNHSDSQFLQKNLNEVTRLDRTCWLVISKTGLTIDVLSMANVIFKFLEENKISLKTNVKVVTENQKSPLRDWAIKADCEIWNHPDNIGGRFSALSIVGLLPCAFAGVNLNDLKLGATEALNHADKIAEMLAHTMESFNRKEFITNLWPYDYRFTPMCKWWQQLWAESLAKAFDLSGNPGPLVSTPNFCLGTVDQHSILQQIADGQKDKFVWFLFNRKAFVKTKSKNHKNYFIDLSYLENFDPAEVYRAQAHGTLAALKEKGVSCLSLEFDQFNAKEGGYFIMFFELLVAALGEALNINPYDQPGVELGKKLCVEELKKSSSHR